MRRGWASAAKWVCSWRLTGNADAIHVPFVEFVEPELLVFCGRNNQDAPAELIQHVLQTNLVLIAAKKLRKVSNRIGFVYSANGALNEQMS